MERQSTRKLFKLVIALVALFTLALSVFAFGACGGEEHKHVYESSGKTAATCGTIGVETFTCSCGDTYVAVTPATGSHKWGADGYCETCGLPNFGADVTIPAFPTIPDGFTAEDLAAIQKAITDSQKGITDAQQAAHDALGQKIDGLDTHPVHKFEKEGAVKTLTMSGSCTTYGVKFTLSTCDVCGATFLTGIEKDGKLGHTSDGGKVAVEPTCQQFGSWQETCTVCGEVINERTLNTVPHDHSVKSAQSVEPGCVTDGLYVYECKWCHEIQPQYNEVKKANPGHHTMPETAKPEDCTVEGGTVTYECTVCGEETTENFEKKSAHEWVYSDVEMTLCGESATVTRSCKNCKVVQENVTVTKDMTDVVTALGDKWSTAHPERTTEESKVVYVPYKDKAGNLLNNWTKFKADNGLTDDADPANLKEDSEGYNAENNVVKYTYYECATCGQPIKVASEAETHNFRVDTTKADWAGHKLDTDGNPIAECVDYTAHWKCIDSSCKDLDITYDQLVKGEGHKWANGAIDWTEETVVAKGGLATGWAFKKDADGNDMVATCTEVGKAFRYCTVCNVDEDNNYDSTKTCGYEEHDVSMVDHVIDRDADTYEYHAPTCTEAGYEEGPCLNCKQATVRNEFEKTEHEWSDWERVYGTEGAAPCQSIVERKTCSNCGATEDREIKSKFEHQGVREWKVNTYPTCTTSGNVVYICDECGETWNEDVPALGHKKAENPHVVDPTCTQNGWSEEYCERCGEAIGERTILPATGHTVAGQRVGIMNAFGVIVWNYGDTRAEFDKLIKDYVDCRDYLYTRDFCKDCDWVSDVIYQIPLLDHDFQWRTDWDDLTPEQQLEAAQNGDFYQPVIITPATCENYGTYGYLCENCGTVVFQGYYGPYGHWYYKGVTRSEAEGMPADELEKHLNVVGGNESSCLAPGSVTVECVYCGVRYAYGTSTDPETMGHSWKLIEATDNNNVLCGEYLSSKTLAYCEKCGLVAELTGTTLPANNYATYLGKEDLTETQIEILSFLDGMFDEHNNLCVKFEDEISELDISLVVLAFKSTEMQTHKFVDEEKYRVYLLDADCTTPTAYVVVCSICGLDENEQPVIKADTKDYTDYLWTLRAEASSLATFWDGLGYSNFNKAFLEEYEYDLDDDGEAETVTNFDLYQALVATYLETYEGGAYTEAFEKVKTNVRYSGFNFTKFNFEPNGHNWLTNNAECEVDVLLSYIFEDYVQGTNGIIAKADPDNWKSNAGGLANKGNYYYKNGKVEDGFKTLGDVLSATGKANALFKDHLTESFEKYADVITYLNTEKPTISKLPDGYKGISDWCQKETCPSKTADYDGDLCYGFKLATDHDIKYQVRVKGGEWDTDHWYTYTEGDSVSALPTKDEAQKMVDNGEIQIALVQYLYSLDATKLSDAQQEVYELLADEFKIANVLSGDGRLTCLTRGLCTRHDKCGYLPVEGDHAMPDGTNPDDLANCQHANRCVACGDYYDGAIGKHKLVAYSDLTDAQKAIAANIEVFKKLLEKVVDDPTCYHQSGASFTVCVYCLEASETDTWRKPAAEAATGDGWVKGTNYTEVTASTIPHSFTLTAAKETLTKLYKNELEGVEETDVEKTIKGLLLKEFNGFKVDAENLTATFESTAANGDKTTITVSFDTDGYLVYTTVVEKAVDKVAGDCTGAKTTTVSHLCLVCTCGLDGNVSKIAKEPGKDSTTTTDALKHVYAPAINQDNAKEGSVNLYCLRCGETANNTHAELSRKVAEKSVAYYATKDAFETAKGSDAPELVPDIEELEWNDEKCGEVEGLTIAATADEAKTALTEAASEGGTVAVGADTTLDSVLTVSKDTVIELAEGTTLTLGDAGTSSANGNLTIKGGTLELPKIKANNAAGLCASGENGHLTLEGVTVNANASIYAETNGTVEIINSFVRSNYGYGLCTNNTTSPCTFVIKNSTIASMDQANGEGTGNTGNVGLMINNPDNVVNAENSTFYGVCTGAWIRGGKATFKDCTFITGSAKTSTIEWKDGNKCPDDAKAALLIGNGGGSDSYGSAEVTLTNCKSIVSLEKIDTQKSNAPADGNLVTIDENADNSAKIKATEYTPADGATAAKKLVLAVYNASAVKLTLDTASATNFGVSADTMVKDTNVYVVGDTAQLTQIEITVNGSKFNPKEGE